MGKVMDGDGIKMALSSRTQHTYHFAVDSDNSLKDGMEKRVFNPREPCLITRPAADNRSRCLFYLCNADRKIARDDERDRGMVDMFSLQKPVEISKRVKKKKTFWLPVSPARFKAFLMMVSLWSFMLAPA
jgi:hypothetical protein